MRNILAAALCAFAIGAGVPSTADACDKDGKKHDQTITETTNRKADKVATASFKVTMKCGNCADKVKTALVKQDGVLKVTISLADNRVTVDYDAKKLDPTKLAKVIKDGTGYTAETEA